MSIKDTDRVARANYRKKVEELRVSLFPPDQDIKDRLAERTADNEGKATYVKRLIREDIKRTNKLNVYVEDTRRRKMKNVKFEKLQHSFDNLQVDKENLIHALTKLLEITHTNGLDEEAVKALSECGITLEIEEELEEEFDGEDMDSMLRIIKELADKCETLDEFRKALARIIANK